MQEGMKKTRKKMLEGNERVDQSFLTLPAVRLILVDRVSRQMTVGVRGMRGWEDEWQERMT